MIKIYHATISPSEILADGFRGFTDKEIFDKTCDRVQIKASELAYETYLEYAESNKSDDKIIRPLSFCYDQRSIVESIGDDKETDINIRSQMVLDALMDFPWVPSEQDRIAAEQMRLVSAPKYIFQLEVLPKELNEYFKRSSNRNGCEVLIHAHEANEIFTRNKSTQFPTKK